ncbi:MAG: GNAT family N-acetyltransferase [Balneolaceae bacterium]
MDNPTHLLTREETILKREIKSKTDFRISIYKEINVLDKLHAEWSELAEKSDQTICMSPEWMETWWKHFGRHKRRSLFIITVYDENKLIAIFPFYKGYTMLGGKVIEQRLQLIGSGGSPNEQFGFSDDYGISDFLDFIVDPEYNESIADLFISLLKSSDLSKHHITFHQVREDSFIKQHLYTKLAAEFEVNLEHTDTCPYIDLEGIDSLKSFIKQCKSNARRRFRQTLRAEGPDKDYEIERAQKPDDLAEMINKLIELHQNRWNDIGFPGAFNDERFIRFFKDLVFSAYQTNRLWFKQATDESGICASRMLLLYNGRYYDYMTGFDDNSPGAKRRPGIGLLLNLVEDALQQSVQRVELLRGLEEYKLDFTDKTFKNYKITIPAIDQRFVGMGIPLMLVHAGSFLYKNIACELELMKVQYKKSGLLKMFVGYFQFRKQSVINKLKERG